MEFDLCNAPATFQRPVNQILGDIPNCSAYLDDIAVYTSTLDEHMKVLRQVFTRLAQASLTLNQV